MTAVKMVLRYIFWNVLILVRSGSRISHRRIVSGLRSHVQVLDAFWRIDLQAKFAPLSILRSIGRMISDHVLVLEFHRNFRADIFQFVDGIRKERSPSGE